MHLIATRLIALCAVALLCACGGGDGGTITSSSSSTSAVVAEAKLQSITLQPANPVLATGATLQLVASGTYADGSVKVVTDGLKWSTTGVNSQIFTSGIVKGLNMGSDTLTVSVGSLSATAQLTVNGPYTQSTAGGAHSLAVLADGTLLGWGMNHSGQLGDASLVQRLAPTAAAAPGANWSRVAAGEFHTLATRSDNSLWAWGLNQNGQVGDKTVMDRPTPVQIGSEKKWLVITAGKAHSIGVKDDGTLWAWGRNYDGQLGDATGVDKLTPTQFLLPVTTTGTTTTPATPTATAADKTWVFAAAGANFTIARKADSSIFLWGGNDRAQLGNSRIAPVGTATNLPTMVPGLKAIAIAAGSAHAMAIRSDGALFAWGANEMGQLGFVSVLDLAGTPTQVGTDTTWKAIAAGGAHSLGVKIDGSLWAWGANTDGQLGVGSTANVRSPVQVGQARDWVAVSAGKLHSMALKSNGTLWVWGRNAEGQQGNGAASATPILVPTQLP